METERTHRMTELFGRLTPGTTLDTARAELESIHGGMMGEHPESYVPSANMRLTASRLRDQLAAPARAILLVLLAAAGIVFVIACSNVANLILARSVRREGELAVRAALGAGTGALRRTLLAESLVLCGAGAILGVLIARPFVTVIGRYAARFSVRALDVTVDASLLWVGVGLALAAAVLLAFVPRLPSTYASAGFGLATGSGRMTAGTNRRLRAFAMTQVALSFVLLAGAGTLLAALVAMQTANTGYDTQKVLAFDVPTPSLGASSEQEMDLYRQATQRISAMAGVEGVALGNFVPWRDAGTFGAGVQFTVEGFTPPNGEENPYARFRIVSPGFFSVLGVPLTDGRDFATDDTAGGEPVVIVSRSVAQRLFPDGDALNRKMKWTDPYFSRMPPRRIVGIVDDVDDENVVGAPALAIYHPVAQLRVAGRLIVRATGDPYALVTPVTRIIHELSAQQPVERAATLEDIRAEVLAPERVNAFVLSGFAGVALLIAVVGVAGVLAFSVSARTREFGVRLAVGSTPKRLLWRVLSEGASIVAIGVIVGAVGGFAFAEIAATYFDRPQMPGVVPVLGATGVLVAFALLASMIPAVRASRVDVLQALRSE
jgi:predicted permease